VSAPQLPQQCSLCRRFSFDTREDPDAGLLTDADEFICEAFPGGIPYEIQLGDFDHNYPYPGDNGLRYQPR
jgi:hypothetical protein